MRCDAMRCNVARSQRSALPAQRAPSAGEYVVQCCALWPLRLAAEAEIFATARCPHPHASHRLASPRIASPRLASPRLASPRLASPRLASPRLARRTRCHSADARNMYQQLIINITAKIAGVAVIFYSLLYKITATLLVSLFRSIAKNNSVRVRTSLRWLRELLFPIDPNGTPPNMRLR